MAESSAQSYANHTRYVPLYHFGVFGVFVVNLFWTLWRLFRAPGADTAMAALLAFALIGLFFFTRSFALTVQDRVIRLEMRLRLERLLPPEQRGRIDELRRAQFVALRFASDDELPALFAEVVEGRLAAGDEIKKKIRHWQADHLRA